MKDLLLSSYDYTLPQEYIATYPIHPKEEAKLLVFNRKNSQIFHTTFKNLQDFLPDCALFFNDTKVIKARIYGTKQSGAKTELLLHQPFIDTKSLLFLVQIKGRVKKDDILYFKQNLKAQITELLDNGLRIVRFFQNDEILNTAQLYNLLDQIGHIPLPPYIKRKDQNSDLKDYQSIFAKNPGAIAAPTASLHFSQNMLEKLSKKHDFYHLTLHVGAGTFKSVECQNIQDHKMHSEFFHIPKNACKIIDSNQAILGIGTTVTRSIEYYVRTKQNKGFCDLFLHPKNPPLRQNYLLTNFHLPKSTLIMLVSAFIGRKQCLKLYELAIKEKYRFYSYGDAMLIL
ncbi:tRNA preQ1(34) S-adenosylmethionine ribosyltransferase-isomerase QueA [Campylobacter sp. VicNov18]|uniref:tRNA preQ1(34) S-adenosylmethionine ribosyltransferase-isomerase QueA n=1 Tax=Campylobacter bilis TaxID=2691918 RepID=UPI00130EA5AD|nr:tRNA preQ1(34) S-adenosylmethionine ribosyltransferase-isomerase QueA [Campylobacter bilis]MPV63384.1 tRNA preQ1(34) S-adenosylmethionine ribosyltransferase-isomerase QueA [Campylobacter hepaticus]MBM0636883.1 tRNA preQ1(34) S-adenosylmethionine ribosyltransferase-isomerase QueA [Campylobacter bilis]MCC8277592.1 tRNA preQ1(34) S-adenosylmethionine ribosyltransferase-isomerase QueA [Campylobacter bilis]MCC8299201.1 tRNA preQ1(34) S-adenosylmethionine ribosyltransferase-isomerase QueA [Campylo